MTNEELNDKYNDLDGRMNFLEKQVSAVVAKVDTYITMANREREEDRARIRQLDEKWNKLNEQFNERMDKLNERMDKTNERMDKTNERIGETVKYIQNLVTVAIVGIAALVVAVILK